MALSLARTCINRVSKPLFHRLVSPAVSLNVRNQLLTQQKYISTTDKQKDAVTVDKGHVENSIYGDDVENLKDRDEVCFYFFLIIFQLQNIFFMILSIRL